MDRTELSKLRRAIGFIHKDEADGGDYSKGMDILSDLLRQTASSLPRGVRPASGYRVTQQCGHKAFTFNRRIAATLAANPCPNCYEQEHDEESFLAGASFWQIIE